MSSTEAAAETVPPTLHKSLLERFAQLQPPPFIIPILCDNDAINLDWVKNTYTANISHFFYIFSYKAYLAPGQYKFFLSEIISAPNIKGGGGGIFSHATQK